jgi:hypothetical protein
MAAEKIVPTEQEPDRAIARVARRRHGVFTRAQALAVGFGPGAIRIRLESGRWEKVHKGVYLLAGVPNSRKQTLMALLLSAGDAAVASHRSAAWLYGLPGGEADRYEITGPRGCRGHPGVRIHQNGELRPVDIAVIDGIPVTTVARTLVDLAGVLEPPVLEEALDAALSRGLRLSRLRWRLDELAKRGRPGVRVLRRLLDARTPGAAVPASVMESRLRPIIAGFPPAEWGHRAGVDGRERFIDLAWPDIKLALEADGFDCHSGRAQFQDDLDRQNALVADEWVFLRFTWQDITERPASVRATIARVGYRLSLRLGLANGWPALDPGLVACRRRRSGPARINPVTYGTRV